MSDKKKFISDAVFDAFYAVRNKTLPVDDKCGFVPGAYKRTELGALLSDMQRCEEDTEIVITVERFMYASGTICRLTNVTGLSWCVRKEIKRMDVVVPCPQCVEAAQAAHAVITGSAKLHITMYSVKMSTNPMTGVVELDPACVVKKIKT